MALILRKFEFFFFFLLFVYYFEKSISLLGVVFI
ncbi:hypothetical protein X975_12871, partial [Stegodyphus mimosarum]